MDNKKYTKKVKFDRAKSRRLTPKNLLKEIKYYTHPLNLTHSNDSDIDEENGSLFTNAKLNRGLLENT